MAQPRYPFTNSQLDKMTTPDQPTYSGGKAPRTLAEIIADMKTTKWVESPKLSQSRSGLGADDVATNVTMPKLNGSGRPRLGIRLGEGVMKALGWNVGDRTIILYHPDDVMTLLIVRSDHNTGIKIAKEGGISRISTIGFTWQQSVPLEARPSILTDFTVHENTLILQLPRK